MNPNYGIILWIVIGALAGWVGSMIMGTNQRQGGLMNIVVGVIGAMLGGFITRTMFNDYARDNGLLASFGVALLGSCVLLFVVRIFSGRGRFAH